MRQGYNRYTKEQNLSDLQNNENSKDGSKVEENKNTLKIIILIVCIVLAIGVTSCGLIYKYIQTTKINNNIEEQVEQDGENIKEENKDAKYLSSFKDIYKVNPLDIKEKSYKDGSVLKDGNTTYKIDINYIEISGLMDKELQNKINEEIKQNAFVLSDNLKSKENIRTYTYVYGNFNNILSLEIDITIWEGENIVKEKRIPLNYNLATSEKIKFLDLFASNTPMNSIIYDVEYKRLAWDTEFNFEMSEEEMDKATNMDRRDTSEYEDLLLQAINKYNKLNKEDILFKISPTTIYFTLNISKDNEASGYAINMYEYIDYIVLYKKFETTKRIYETEPKEEYFVFNDWEGFDVMYNKLETSNLYTSIFSYYGGEYKQEMFNEIKDKYSKEALDLLEGFIQNQFNKIISESKKLANKNLDKGYISRYVIDWSLDEYTNNYGGEPLIYITSYGIIEEMPLEYYNENAFKLLAAHSVKPRVDVGSIYIGELDITDKNIKVKNENPNIDIQAYYDLNGNLVATNYDEQREYINNKYKEVSQ